MPILHLPPLEVEEMGAKELSLLLALLLAFRAKTMPQWHLDLIRDALEPLVGAILANEKPSPPPPGAK
jgi:hypothetical protein